MKEIKEWKKGLKMMKKRMKSQFEMCEKCSLLKYWLMNFCRLERLTLKPKSVRSVRHAFCQALVPNCVWAFSNFCPAPAIHHSISTILLMARRQDFEFVLNVKMCKISVSESFVFQINKKLTNIHATFVKVFCFNGGFVIVLIWRLFEKLAQYHLLLVR